MRSREGALVLTTAGASDEPSTVSDSRAGLSACASGGICGFSSRAKSQVSDASSLPSTTLDTPSQNR